MNLLAALATDDSRGAFTTAKAVVNALPLSPLIHINDAAAILILIEAYPVLGSGGGWLKLCSMK
jgi:hypothetical protein